MQRCERVPFFVLWCVRRILNGWRLFNKSDVAYLLFSEIKIKPHLKGTFYYINLKMLPLYKWGTNRGKAKFVLILSVNLFSPTFCGNSHHTAHLRASKMQCAATSSSNCSFFLWKPFRAIVTFIFLYCCSRWDDATQPWHLIGPRCDRNNVLKSSQAEHSLSSRNPMRAANDSFYTLSKFFGNFLV